MELIVSAVSARMGGAATYLQNVLPELAAGRQLRAQERVLVLVGERGLARAGPGQQFQEVGFSRRGVPGGAAVARVWFDQVALPRMLRRRGAHALFTSANIGPGRAPCRHVVLVRNTLPFDPVFLRRMGPRVRASYAVQRALVLRTVQGADTTLFPSTGMRDLLAAHWKGSPGDWRVAPYGVDGDRFAPGNASPAGPPGGDRFRILHVSTYCDQKNVGTLLAAMELLERHSPGSFRLTLTAGFDKEWMANLPAFPSFRADRRRYLELEAKGAALDTSWRAHSSLPDLYRAADLFVFPSYTESFGHPVMEAMASGLAIVAADTPANRELTDGAAVLVPTFDAHAFAEAIERLAGDPGERERLGERARRRARTFSWADHARALLAAMRGEAHPAT